MKPHYDTDVYTDDVLNDAWHVYSDGRKSDQLWHYFYAILTAPSSSNPYHNVRHPLHTAWLVYQVCKKLREVGAISRREARNIMIAAIMHDYMHSGRSTDLVSDQINIANAVSGLQKIILSKDKKHSATIARYMWATEFPHQAENERTGEMTILHLILRDCDKAQVFSDSWIQQVLVGLSTEWDISPITMLEQQLKYLENLSFETRLVQDMFSEEVVRAKIIETKSFIAGLRSVTE